VLHDDDYVVIALPFDDVTDNLSLIRKKKNASKRRLQERDGCRDKRQRCVMKNSIGFAFFFAVTASCCVTSAWDLCESFLPLWPQQSRKS
jgi:hypothetical protein